MFLGFIEGVTYVKVKQIKNKPPIGKDLFYS
jgi:hypothetical protein